ncbi:hypothetical protein ACH5RR_003061 [Cinchona calisaya]|uniref:Uncharacterized protein n=1 Tax=Cinchona calisaya TaxID=153742 RepID=A0ABD3ATS0_9GENT
MLLLEEISSTLSHPASFANIREFLIASASTKVDSASPSLHSAHIFSSLPFLSPAIMLYIHIFFSFCQLHLPPLYKFLLQKSYLRPDLVEYICFFRAPVLDSLVF